MPNSILGHKHEIQGLAIKCYSKSLFKTVMQLNVCVNMLLNFLGVLCPRYILKNFFVVLPTYVFLQAKESTYMELIIFEKKKEDEKHNVIVQYLILNCLRNKSVSGFIYLLNAISFKFIFTFMPNHGPIKLKRHLTFLRFRLSLRNKKKQSEIVKY